MITLEGEICEWETFVKYIIPSELFYRTCIYKSYIRNRGYTMMIIAWTLFNLQFWYNMLSGNLLDYIGRRGKQPGTRLTSSNRRDARRDYPTLCLGTSSLASWWWTSSTEGGRPPGCPQHFVGGWRRWSSGNCWGFHTWRFHEWGIFTYDSSWTGIHGLLFNVFLVIYYFFLVFIFKEFTFILFPFTLNVLWRLIFLWAHQVIFQQKVLKRTEWRSHWLHKPL